MLYACAKLSQGSRDFFFFFVNKIFVIGKPLTKITKIFSLDILLWLIIFCRGCMCTSKLPEKASLSWVPKSEQVKKLLRVFHLCRVYSLFLAKTRMLSLYSSLLSSSDSLQSSSNTPHITLSEFSLEPIFA